jgi:hypothetical protein
MAKTYNEWQRMHYNAMYPTPQNKTGCEKLYALYDGKNIIERGDYPLLVWVKKQKIKQGYKNKLEIKRIQL